MTSTMSTWRSNQLSYNPLRTDIIPKEAASVKYFFCGAAWPAERLFKAKRPKPCGLERRGTSMGIRTPVFAVRGRRLRPLDYGGKWLPN